LRVVLDVNVLVATGAILLLAVGFGRLRVAFGQLAG
jgi:hypothetical protein